MKVVIKRTLILRLPPRPKLACSVFILSRMSLLILLYSRVSTIWYADVKLNCFRDGYNLGTFELVGKLTALEHAREIARYQFSSVFFTMVKKLEKALKTGSLARFYIPNSNGILLYKNWREYFELEEREALGFDSFRFILTVSSQIRGSLEVLT